MLRVPGFLLLLLTAALSAQPEYQTPEGQEKPAPAEEKPAPEQKQPEQKEPEARPAEAPKEEEKEEELALPESWLDGFKWKALLRFRPEYRGNYDFDKTREDHAEFGGQKIQFGFERDFFESMTASVLIQDSRLWGGQTGSRTGVNTANDATQEGTDVRIAWIEAKDLGPFSVRMGRQIFRFGEERLVGPGEWSNVGRSFDGVSIKLDAGFYSGQLFGSVLAEEDSDSSSNNTAVGPQNSSGFVFTCNSAGLCQVTARTVREAGDQYFAGLYNTFSFQDYAALEVYYLGVYKKWIQRTTPLSIPNAELMTEDRDRQRDNLHTFGGRITNRMGPQRKASWPVPFDFSIEYAWQTGPTGRTIDASWDWLGTTIPSPGGSVRAYREKVGYDAFGVAADAGWTFFSVVRLGAEYNQASGDANRSDGVSSTFNSLFPSGHAFYGQADLVGFSNMIAGSGNLTFFLGKFGKLKLGYWDIRKEQLQDGWYDANGTLKAGESTESFSNTRYGTVDASGYRAAGFLRRQLLKEYELVYSVNWRRLEIGVGYSRVHAGDSIREIKNDTLNFTNSRRMKFDPRADFGYLMLTMVF